MTAAVVAHGGGHAGGDEPPRSCFDMSTAREACAPMLTPAPLPALVLDTSDAPQVQAGADTAAAASPEVADAAGSQHGAAPLCTAATDESGCAGLHHEPTQGEAAAPRRGVCSSPLPLAGLLNASDAVDAPKRQADADAAVAAPEPAEAAGSQHNGGALPRTAAADTGGVALVPHHEPPPQGGEEEVVLRRTATSIDALVNRWAAEAVAVAATPHDNARLRPVRGGSSRSDVSAASAPSAGRSSVFRLSGESGNLAASLRAARASDASSSAHASLRALAPFAPRALLEDIAVAASLNAFMGGVDPVAAALKPHATRAQGAVLVADISGFTALTERLSRRGAAGVELLTRCINSYFSAIADVIFKHGGDVIKFVGDAVIVAFLVNDQLASEPLDAMRRVTVCAARCACELADTLGCVRMQPDGGVAPVAQAAAQPVALPPASRRASGLTLSVISGSSSAVEPRRAESPRISILARARAALGGASSGQSEPLRSASTIGFDSVVMPTSGNHHHASAFRDASRSSSIGMLSTVERGRLSQVSGSGIDDGHGSTKSSTGEHGADDAVLFLKLSLGAGQLRLLTLGGAGVADDPQRWEFLVSDPVAAGEGAGDAAGFEPVFTSQIAGADAAGLKGVTVASPQVVALLGADATCDVTDLASGARVLRAVAPAQPGEAPALPPLPAELASGTQLPPCLLALPRDGVALAAALPLLRAFFVHEIRQRVEAGQYEWLSELRHVTVMFCGVPRLTVRASAGAGTAPTRAGSTYENLGDADGDDEEGSRRAQAAVAAVQRAVRDADGTFLQARCDDKGFVMVSAFGLPGHGHEDDAERGVRAALAAAVELSAAGLPPRLGVTTGRLLCACVGAPGRAEYTAFGDAINLAARLMCAAEAAGHAVLVDAHTHASASHAAMFVALQPLRVKGRGEPIQAYGAVQALSRCQSSSRTSMPLAGPRAPLAAPLPSAAMPAPVRPFVGRTYAVATVVDALHSTLAGACGGAAGGVIVLEADAGMGKSALLRAALSRAGAAQLARGAVCASRGDAATREPLWAWRGIVCDLLMHASAVAAPDDNGGLAWRGVLADALDFDPAELPELLPHFLATGESATADPAPPSEDRFSLVAASLVSLVRATLSTRPVVIIMEDLHMCDTGSVRLAAALAAAVPEVLLLVTTRPLRAGRERTAAAEATAAAQAALAQLRSLPRALTVRLDPLRLEETAALLQAGAGAGAPPLPTRLVAAVHDRASGHPLYLEQILAALRQRAGVPLHAPLCEGDVRTLERALAETDDFLRSAASVHALVMQRIDALQPSTALTLKVAAVTGRAAASLPLLRALHPMRPSPCELAVDLQELQQLDFLVATEAGDADAVAFVSVIVRDVAYELMPTSQRRELHVAAAAELRRPGGDAAAGPGAAAAVVWHLTRAAEGRSPLVDPEMSLKLIAAWADAGAAALARAVPDEAGRCYTAAASVAEVLADAGACEAALAVDMHVRAAEAHASGGQLPAAAEAAAAALRRLGVQLSKNAPRKAWACFGACSAADEDARGAALLRRNEAAAKLAQRAADVLGRSAAALPNAAAAPDWSELAHKAHAAARRR